MNKNLEQMIGGIFVICFGYMITRISETISHGAVVILAPVMIIGGLLYFIIGLLGWLSEVVDETRRVKAKDYCPHCERETFFIEGVHTYGNRRVYGRKCEQCGYIMGQEVYYFKM